MKRDEADKEGTRHKGRRGLKEDWWKKKTRGERRCAEDRGKEVWKELYLERMRNDRKDGGRKGKENEIEEMAGNRREATKRTRRLAKEKRQKRKKRIEGWRKKEIK